MEPSSFFSGVPALDLVRNKMGGPALVVRLPLGAEDCVDCVEEPKSDAGADVVVIEREEFSSS